MKRYFLNNDDIQTGPFNLEQLNNEYIKANTMVWAEGFEYWIKASECPELKLLISELPPAIKKSHQPQQYEAKTNSKGNVLYYKKIKSEKTGTEPFALVSFAAGIGGFLILPIIFVPIGYIATIVSYYRLKEDKSLRGSAYRIIGAVLNTINILWLMYQYKFGFFR